MDFGKKQIAILYIDTNKVYFALDATVLSVDFPTDVISDLEVVNKEILQQMFMSFLEENKITPLEIAIVFSTAILFEKDFGEDTPKQTEEEIQRYLDLVPFDDVLSKTFKLNKKTRVVALNKKLYETIRLVLEKNKFTVLSATPFSLVQEVIPELASNIDFNLMVAKIDVLRQYSMISENQIAIQHKEEKTTPAAQKNTRLYIFIGIFAVLLLVLVILVITTLQPAPAPQKTSTVLPPLVPVQRVSPLPTGNTSTSSATVSNKVSTSSAGKFTQ